MGTFDQEDTKIKKDNFMVEEKPEDKSKNEEILPDKDEEGIRPKLKQTRNAEKTESPLEKLRRLENAKPTKIEPDKEELVISELPSYDLPAQRQKNCFGVLRKPRK